MVYDCFAFFNEFDLLEIRINEMASVVDKFVIVEATKTFQKKDKPLYFEQNQDRFRDFRDKIIHVVVDKYPTFFTHWRVPRTWDFDNHQKEQILAGLKDAGPNDTIIISDVDEIPLASKVAEYKNAAGIKVFEQFLCFYYVNNICRFLNIGPIPNPSPTNNGDFGFWRGTVMLDKKDLTTVQEARRMRDAPEDQIVLIREGGWHFSYMGGVEKIIQKIEAWTHKEFNTPENKNPDRIREAIYSGSSLFDDYTKFKLVDVNDPRYPFPKTLIHNEDKYRHLILDGKSP